LLEESLSLAQDLDDKSAKGSAQLAMGQLELAEGRPDARERMLAALRLGATEPREAASGLTGLSALALKENDPRFAAQLLGAVRSALAPLGLVVEPLLKGLHARTLVEVKSALGESAFQAAFEEGGRWTLKEAVRQVLAEHE
jgi:hypothetical protein